MTLSHHTRYALKVYRSMPVTFLRRVVVGRDPYWRQYFWSRWGILPAGFAARDKRQTLLIDALSGGEITQLVTFCARLREALPGWRLVISTNNKYSFDFAHSMLDVDDVIDSPWDCRWPVRRLLRALEPRAVVCVQNLSSPVLLMEARHAGITTVIVSGLWSCSIEKHSMSYRAVELEPLPSVDWVGAWGDEDARNYIAGGLRPERVFVTGNMKFDFDFLEVAATERDALRQDLGLSAGEPVLLAASVHPREERLVADAYLEARQHVPGLRLVLVPRYAFDIPAMGETLTASGIDFSMRSAGAPVAGAHRAIVVDTFGELGRLYATASVIFLGGTTYVRNILGLGQNPAEPLIQRKPLFFGPCMALWTEVTSTLTASCPELLVTTADELARGVVAALTDGGFQRRFAAAASVVLDRHRGDIDRNVRLVLRALGAAAPEMDVLPTMAHVAS